MAKTGGAKAMDPLGQVDLQIRPINLADLDEGRRRFRTKKDVNQKCERIWLQFRKKRRRWTKKNDSFRRKKSVSARKKKGAKAVECCRGEVFRRVEKVKRVSVQKR